ncbi:MAG: DUF4389 domain-containing protein [Dehalococcoidia bacterium]|nr:DUF4389 domain-containing protein [Dehalococcoidia bacterium]
MYTSKRAPSHPAIVSLPYPKQQARWLPLAKLLLAVPHLVVMVFLIPAALLATIVAALLITVTRRLPRPLFDFLLGVDRYYLRLNAYLLLMCDQYPPFRLREGGYQVELSLPHPDRYSRWLPPVKWLLTLPHLLVLEVFDDFALVLAFVALFAILFTRRYPAGLFELNLGFLRWQARAFTYAGLLTDKYPPYQLEE